MEITPAQRAQVEAAAGFGLTQEKIAILMGVSETALKKYCGDELHRGVTKADLQVMQNLFRIATGNTPQAVSAAIFWAKVRMRWHEVQRVIHGFDPELMQVFVQQIIEVLRRLVPKVCPHCKTDLELRPKIASELRALSLRMNEQLPASEIVPTPATPHGGAANAEGAGEGAPG